MPSRLEQKSDACWNLGLCLLAEGHVDAAANRIYYSVFQMVCEAMYQNPLLSFEAPDEVPHQEALSYVGRGKPGIKGYYGSQLAKLFALRKKADYRYEGVMAGELQKLLADAKAIREEHRTAIQQFQNTSP